tara:strand:+ start:2512 stop:3477 length:966 start_codon:yes stop_codon:yes gene_type:complete
MTKSRIRIVVIIGSILALIFLLKTCLPGKPPPPPPPEVADNHKITLFLDLSDHLDTAIYENKPFEKYRYQNFIHFAQIFGEDYVNFLNESLKPIRKFDEELGIQTHPLGEFDIDNYLTDSQIKIDKNNAGNYFLDNDTVIPHKLKVNVKGILGNCREKFGGTKNWPGSNLYGFLEEKDFYDKKKKNLLIIYTDGYPYHKDLKPEEEKWFKSSSSGHWKNSLHNKNKSEVMQLLKDDPKLGLKKATDELENLRVLIIGTMPMGNNNPSKEKDLIKLLWENWFTKMGVKADNIKVMCMDDCSTIDVKAKHLWLLETPWHGIDY